MLACLDVQYRATDARAACVIFGAWEASDILRTETALVTPIVDYEPGYFYRRELPCLLEVLKHVPEEITTLIVDGYVSLGKERPGLGYHLYDALGRKAPVVGVAKSVFEGADAKPVVRGESQNPLWVTSVGIHQDVAAKNVERMHGVHRIPTLLRAVDYLAREGKLPS